MNELIIFWVVAAVVFVVEMYLLVDYLKWQKHVASDPLF